MSRTMQTHEQEIDAMRQAFGARLHALRKTRGWQLDDIALRVGMTKTSISRIEKGKQNITMVDIMRIARALEVSPASLFEDDGTSLGDISTVLAREEAARCVKSSRVMLADVSNFVQKLEASYSLS